jgi:hypothetical protein
MKNIVIIFTIMLISISIVLASTFDAQAKSHKTTKARVIISLNDYGCYTGKVGVTLKNVESGVTLIKNKVVSLKHDTSRLFKYDPKNSQPNDELKLILTAKGGQYKGATWTTIEHYQDNLVLSGSLEEISDC